MLRLRQLTRRFNFKLKFWLLRKIPGSAFLLKKIKLNNKDDFEIPKIYL